MLSVTLVIKLCISIKEGMHLPYKAHLVLISSLIVYSVCTDSSYSCDPVLKLCNFRLFRGWLFSTRRETGKEGIQMLTLLGNCTHIMYTALSIDRESCCPCAVSVILTLVIWLFTLDDCQWTYLAFLISHCQGQKGKQGSWPSHRRQVTTSGMTLLSSVICHPTHRHTIS